MFRGQVFGSGEGRTKKRAEQQAAYEALLKLKKWDNQAIIRGFYVFKEH